MHRYYRFAHHHINIIVYRNPSRLLLIAGGSSTLQLLQKVSTSTNIGLIYSFSHIDTSSVKIEQLIKI